MMLLSMWHGLVETRRPGGNALLRDIVATVAVSRGLTASEIMSGCRRYHITHARQEAMRRAYDTGRFSNARIGRFFGLDHSTVIHGRRAAERRAAQAQQAPSAGARP